MYRLRVSCPFFIDIALSNGSYGFKLIGHEIYNNVYIVYVSAFLV